MITLAYCTGPMPFSLAAAYICFVHTVSVDRCNLETQV